MPEYIYENPETGEQVTVLQSVHEEHIYEIDVLYTTEYIRYLIHRLTLK